ncbi:transcriptional regulator [Pseudohongiella acticola]|jgi:BolA family transcriptional regulator, general stress-responsive regulator|uniref:Transcriptional regulator n=1 Tax=Pseudohongiella acticola TaxID=1524254 RepID=A0A1E8CHA4_9GAMM|nr:BolA/IbaG family iron-sulfur metabolism protein [Pseudohongiella acticola]OFE11782.1 transcriptional regulator [Pseudohongiella acticola]
MKTMHERIEGKLQAQIQPTHYDIINESHMHSGPATESHFKLIVVAEHFTGLNAVKRHQALYGLLAEELREGVHALALHTYTPEEWAQNQQGAPDSPNCRGGSQVG